MLKKSEMPEIKKKKQEIKEYLELLKKLCATSSEKRILKYSDTAVQST